MFGFTFFSNKVARYMFRMGYPANKMPPPQVFKPLCDALKANGYSAEKAASLWIKCLQDNNEEAIKEFYQATGNMATILLEPPSV